MTARMGNSCGSSYGSGLASSIGRGAGLFAGLGGALGGVAGTLDWPIVGTFFGAVEAAPVGAIVGLLAAPALTLLGRRTRSRWAARTTSGVIAGMAAAAAVVIYAGPITVAPMVPIGLVAAAAVLGGVFGPLIAYGFEPVATAARMLHIGGLILIWGAALGAAGGGVAGFVIGVRAYLPTAPVAGVEGAVLGLVSGVVVACLAAGVVVLPRISARR